MTECRRRDRWGSRRQTQLGFTLTEMLVVIAIIGVLASLITVAAMSAMDTGKQVAIKLELDNIDAAFKDFKNKYGAFPPCDLSNPTTNTALLSFVMQAFPRYQPLATNATTNKPNILSDWAVLGIDTTTAHPDRAIVFWLSGFSPDLTNPFTGAGARTPFYAFDNTRLYNVNGSSAGLGASGYSAPTFTGIPATTYNTTYNENQKIGNYGYVPPRGNNTPYVYFDAASSYGTITPSTPSFTFLKPYTFNNAAGTAAGTAVPFVQDLTNAQTAGHIPVANASYQFCNPTTFQIIAAGQDGLFGTPSASGYANLRMYPTGYGYSADGSDTDNLSNFCEKARLGDAVP